MYANEETYGDSRDIKIIFEIVSHATSSEEFGISYKLCRRKKFIKCKPNPETQPP